MVKRVIFGVVGVLLLLSFLAPGPEQGSALSPTNAAQGVGYYGIRGVIFLVALWMVFRAIVPKRQKS